METTHKALAKAFSKGHFDFAYNHLTDDIEWHIIGDKTVTGKESVIDHCNKMLVEIASSTLNNTHIVAENDCVVIEGHCKYTNADDKDAEVAYCDVYRFENGHIKAITSYCIDFVKK